MAFEKGYPIDFSKDGETTANAINKLIKETDKLYKDLNSVLGLIPAEEIDNTGITLLSGIGTFTVPSGITKLIVSGAAGGGGGSGGTGVGGGGGQSMLRQTIAVTERQEIIYEVGTGGLGCQIPQNAVTTLAGNLSGTAGSDTIFGTLLLKGGLGGQCNGNSVSPGMNGGSGAYKGTAFSLQNLIGVLDKFCYNGGNGGGTLFGQGGSGGQCLEFAANIPTLTNGENGLCYGTGGGGAGHAKDASHIYCSKAGNGANGILIIEMRG